MQTPASWTRTARRYGRGWKWRQCANMENATSSDRYGHKRCAGKGATWQRLSADPKRDICNRCFVRRDKKGGECPALMLSMYVLNQL